MSHIVLAEDPTFTPYISVEFTRDENNRGLTTLTVKSNISPSDEGPKGPGGIGGAPRTLPETGEAIMTALVKALARKRWMAERNENAWPEHEEPPHAKSAFHLTATLHTEGKDTTMLRGIFEEAIKEARKDVALAGYGVTSDSTASRMSV